jgi:hypothetical protein
MCRDADDAVYECNGKDLLGARITVELAKVGHIIRTLSVATGISGWVK